MRESGKFIVFEGLDGSGKSTQISRLREYLAGVGRNAAITAEPTDGDTGRLLREALAGRIVKSPCGLAALFTLDRIEHSTAPGGISDMLAAGVDVLCDRYYYSSIAYQGAVTDARWVTEMNLGCPEIRRPDMCVFLDLAPARCMERISSGRRSLDIFERREFLERVRESYFSAFERLRLEYGERIEIIDASGDVEEVARAVVGAIRTLY